MEKDQRRILADDVKTPSRRCPASRGRSRRWRPPRTRRGSPCRPWRSPASSSSVAMQKDFVRLSQSLQVELEKIRQQEKEVRWQHEEDVEECGGCRLGFSIMRRKHH